jgi:hypothetical protein
MKNPSSAFWIVICCFTILLVAGCSTSLPEISTITPTIPDMATATTAATVTPLPPSQAIELGVLGKGSARDIAWEMGGSRFGVCHWNEIEK